MLCGSLPVTSGFCTAATGVMLEQAAGCLKHAKRRFLRDSNGIIRTRKSLPRHFWKHRVVVPCWLFALLQTSGQRLSPTPGSTKNNTIANDAATPLLDFLYPRYTRQLAPLSLSHPPKRLGLRRRKKTLDNFLRSYGSKAETSHAAFDNGTNVQERMPELEKENEQTQTKENLSALLDQEGSQFDRAWILYISAGYPQDLKSALCAYLSRSEHSEDQRRAWGVFKQIAPRNRSAYDYRHITQSQLLSAEAPELKSICREALSRGFGDQCCVLAFAYYVKKHRWFDAREVWEMGSQSRSSSYFSHLDYLTLFDGALSLGDFLEAHPNHVAAFHDFAHSFLGRIFNSVAAIESTSSETILRILQMYHELNILHQRHYFDLILTLQSSDVRSTFVRAIVFYRHFRWQMPDRTPPRMLLDCLLKSLVSFGIPSGIQYLLDEWTRFHVKPNIEAYKYALVGLSRAGELAQVKEVFEKLVEDHGRPRHWRLLTPLLYVHARLGNVEETLRQFRSISEDFGVERKTACWNIVLTAYANANDLAGTFSVLNDMLQQGLRPNSHTFGTVMGLCANRGDVDNVRRLLKEAHNHGVWITMPMADTLVEAFVKNGRPDLAETMAEHLLTQDIPGSRVRMWNTLIRGYALRVDFESITRVRARMDSVGLEPDSMTYAYLMLSLVLVGKVDMARRILRRLHRIKHLYANQYHYSVILYGYVRKQHRDMAHVVLRENQERFGRPSSQISLLKLRSQIQRDLQGLRGQDDAAAHGANLRLHHAEKFLREAITDIDPSSLITETKLPSPGVGGSSRRRAFVAAHYETLIKAYGARGALEQARTLFDECVKNTSPENVSHDDEAVPFRLVEALMVSHVRAGEHKKVEECWQTVFSGAARTARRVDVDLDEIFVPHRSKAESSPLFLEPPRPSFPTSTPNTNTQELLVNSSPTSPGPEAPEQKPDILPSKRYILSRPLTLYMQSLGHRGEHWRILDVVKEVEAVGFSLSTFNWSTFVQMLSTSNRYTDQLEAFRVFEEKFMPNFPGWYRLHRGYALRPRDAPASLRRMERYFPRQQFLGSRARSYWSKMQPDFTQPTYVTLVYLSAALQRIRERSIVGGAEELNTLYATAQKTIRAIGKMPTLREEYQGALLRHRSRQGNVPDKFVTRQPYTWGGGILGVGGFIRRRNTAQPRMWRKKNASGSEPALKAKARSAFKGQDDWDESSGIVAAPESISGLEDEYDLAAETSLLHRGGVVGDEPQDIPWRIKRWRRQMPRRSQLYLERMEKERQALGKTDRKTPGKSDDTQEQVEEPLKEVAAGSKAKGREDG